MWSKSGRLEAFKEVDKVVFLAVEIASRFASRKKKQKTGVWINNNNNKGRRKIIIIIII